MIFKEAVLFRISRVLIQPQNLPQSALRSYRAKFRQTAHTVNQKPPMTTAPISDEALIIFRQDILIILISTSRPSAIFYNNFMHHCAFLYCISLKADLIFWIYIFNYDTHIFFIRPSNCHVMFFARK